VIRLTKIKTNIAQDDQRRYQTARLRLIFLASDEIIAGAMITAIHSFAKADLDLLKAAMCRIPSGPTVNSMRPAPLASVPQGLGITGSQIGGRRDNQLPFADRHPLTVSGCAYDVTSLVDNEHFAVWAYPMRIKIFRQRPPDLAAAKP